MEKRDSPPEETDDGYIEMQAGEASRASGRGTEAWLGWVPPRQALSFQVHGVIFLSAFERHIDGADPMPPMVGRDTNGRLVGSDASPAPVISASAASVQQQQQQQLLLEGNGQASSRYAQPLLMKYAPSADATGRMS